MTFRTVFLFDIHQFADLLTNFSLQILIYMRLLVHAYVRTTSFILVKD